MVLAADVLAWLAVVAVNPAYQAPMGRGYYGAAWTLLFLTFVTLAVTAPALYVLVRRIFRPATHPTAALPPGPSQIPLLLAIFTALGPAGLQLRLHRPTLAAIGLLWPGPSPPSDPRPLPGHGPRLVGLIGGRLGCRDGRCRPRLPDLLGIRSAGKRAAIADISRSSRC